MHPAFGNLPASSRCQWPRIAAADPQWEKKEKRRKKGVEVEERGGGGFVCV